MKLFNRKQTVSIFRHYFLMLTGIVLICLTVASFSLMFLVSSYWSSDLDEILLNNTKTIANYILQGEKNQNINITQIQSAMKEIADSSETDSYVLDKNGKIIICSDLVANETDKNTCSKHSTKGFSQDTLNLIKQSEHGYLHKGAIDIDKPDVNYFLAATVVDDGNNHYYVINVQQYSIGYMPYITQYVKMILMSICIAIVLAFFASWAATYRIVRPLKKMAEATKHYANGDFNYQIKDTGKFAEFHELADAFNIMAKKLEENEVSRRNFVANVSHELKTPMTTISGFVDGILDGTIPQEDSKKYLKIVSEVVQHLSELVISMLNMSRIEAGKLKLEYSEFSYTQTLIHTIIGFEKAITDKGIDVVGLDKLDEITIRADEALTRQILYNLIDNAVKFSSTDSVLKIELYEEKNKAVFMISNSGSTISPEDLSNIFERFYKIDKSRGLDASSFGLGLYIVKSIVEMHAGTIKAISKDNHTKFIVKLPL